MKLKFLADVHISPITVKSIKAFGYQIHRVTEFLPPNATDEAIVELARREGAVIITQDLDFSAIVVKDGQKYPSVVSLRMLNAKPDFIADTLISILPLLKKDLKGGVIVSVEDKKYRVRRIPF